MRKVMEMRSYNDKSICCFRFKQCNTISITNLGERWTTSTVRLSHIMCECLYLFFSASLILLVLNELLSIIECFFSFFINSFCFIDHLLNSSICLFLAQSSPPFELTPSPGEIVVVCFDKIRMCYRQKV